ncbi:putative 4-hydroxy-4-methyl-2-oxoglutarate aldolase [Marinomonas sp. UCMA 3892]|jgi:regulator of ribonuclease activity A|uniref:Putative 4-hydroxy-4-methyl-2-oxoglutarate aldolase n=1 Tax=Marinomonas sp. (strain MWYL1) TaxID=400668 RepID=RRAAH_MARMS|nr:putative 4-hydroxy-4-methyl-2-oxoglutarate aldolase [Marinomonas sp. UCMA 3892]A6VX14.1 RecName: Full=Putative 4-hydroxy-4-methyl-2-oxoglutarate aldolase; Short=HMG aldolase; AltName: Full=Oxaloacetate decarboxylase; Short=OAA decarboxylase; AltName: Full=Regulator of ribonuclease activity homolog; AltName: Full=RraA-like protein [Marinomonas sp. MWYL1]NLU99458.1 putative 4-hydroxy-4-methyl-2-oxoglutarate aldolase [Marinomonas sp. UCMA 3892]
MKDLLPDLCDLYPEKLQIAEPIFTSYGKRSHFYGEVVTVSCFEDNSRVRELVAENGKGKVMVIDGGGSKRRALLGDMLAEKAVDNGWEGFVINGAIRDIAAQSQLNIGIHALCAHPMPTEKRGLGDLGKTLRFAGMTIAQGDYIYCDLNGIVVSKQPLALP